jgi:nucleoside-diphosphate-sugar epimerase
MSLPPIALAGATGNLGLPILHTLLSTGYPVTILTRLGSTHSSVLPPHPSLTITSVDFTSVASLTSALTNIHAVISCLATSAISSQTPLIDACIASGVHRFIPAEFGMDSLNPLAAKLPVCQPKVATQEYLKMQASARPGFTWTGIANGMFLDWGIKMGLLVDVKKHTATLYNGGDVRFSATRLEDVASAVVGVLGNLEGTRNRLVYVHSAVVTQNQLIGYVREKDGKEWDVVVRETEVVKKESYDELDRGDGADVEAAMLGFCITAMFDEEYGCDFSEKLDNETVGLSEIGDGGVRKVVEGCM